MTDSIKPGDLVMVVKPSTCCGNTNAIGKVLTVQSMGFYIVYRCRHCLKDTFGGRGFVDMTNGMSYEKFRLKKIDPPALDESVERVRELESA